MPRIRWRKDQMWVGNPAPSPLSFVEGGQRYTATINFHNLYSNIDGYTSFGLRRLDATDDMSHHVGVALLSCTVTTPNDPLVTRSSLDRWPTNLTFQSMADMVHRQWRGCARLNAMRLLCRD